MSITVLKAGFQTTVQDLGRNGYTHFGFSPAGAADAYSLRHGNLLVGNRHFDAGLEMTLVGGSYKFNQNALVALTGSRFSATLDDKKFPYFETVNVKKDQNLEIGPSHEGARCYLCVRGGFDVPSVLGSRSTYLMIKLGGFEGRALQCGDKLNFGKPISTVKPSTINTNKEFDRSHLRVIPGLQKDWFSSDSWDLFLNATFSVSEQSNRMGLRIEGSHILPTLQRDVLTEGLPVGSVQIPGSGQPIISFVDHQTTGGYPKIANVIAADICKVGQLKPGDNVKFELVSMEDAEKFYFEQESLLSR